jgi:hypothetical protein
MSVTRRVISVIPRLNIGKRRPLLHGTRTHSDVGTGVRCNVGQMLPLVGPTAVVIPVQDKVLAVLPVVQRGPCAPKNVHESEAVLDGPRQPMHPAVAKRAAYAGDRRLVESLPPCKLRG